MTNPNPPAAPPDDEFEDLGPNAGLVEEIYRRFRENPDSVAESWRDFFSDYRPRAPFPRNGGDGAAAAAPPVPTPAPAPPVPSAPPAAAPAPPTSSAPAPAPAPAPAAAPAPPAAAPAPAAPAPAAPAPAASDGARPEPLRGVAARTVENMEASLAVPTATSVRAVPAKLLEVNRQILNNHLARTSNGKVSYTHLIAYAVVRALADFPNVNSAYAVEDGKPAVVRHEHVNLGLAVDQQKRDGSRSLIVPNIKAADTMDFATFWTAYEELIRKIRTNQIAVEDFAGTTGTITNPGMIGTVHSVPRLMPGQGFILGVGAIGVPAEFEGADPAALAQLGIGAVTTLTNTYDHRIIGGAESGEFLRRIHDLLVGHDGFYDDVFRSLGVPYEPARWSEDRSAFADQSAQNEKSVHVHQLINMYRVRGHLLANLDPLGRREPNTHPELDISHYGLSIWDLAREFPVGSLGAGRIGRNTMPLRDILGVLRDAYARTVGVEYMHIQEHEQKAWIQEQVEGTGPTTDHDDHRRILERLNAAEAFERFLHTKYLGQKRFSLEGAEALIPMLDELCSEAADTGMAEVVIGMAHRGRLNVLANVLGKSYGQIFREFEGELDPGNTQGSGDVKYHLGTTGTHRSPAGHQIGLTLAANPSHLEAVDPVVEGMARAKEDLLGPSEARGARVLPVLVHGDAAFAGQGVVAETLNLSEVDGYDVGGTIHVVVNNQLGFTTAPESGRSGVYATDVAKMVQAPIFHVNGDDPEACVRVVRLAFEFRRTFNKDVVIDLVCYRRYGHNEGDEPAFTQPAMYALIDVHRSVRKLYTEHLVNRGDLTLEECEAALADFQARLSQAFEETRGSLDDGTDDLDALDTGEPDPGVDPAVTAVRRPVLDRVVAALAERPEGFEAHPKLERILGGERNAYANGTVDWSLAEALAFGSLLMDGTPIRLAGQDTRRGTFSQRHGVLVDHRTGSEYVPLQHIDAEQARFQLYDSVLSEYAALGFEYGYSVADRSTLVLWEAQFGDFANGAQIIIDQFVVAAADKWGQHSSLALLLPHGFEGQGPEHSSARLERFLALCADENLRVVYPSTAAQYFHALRRQALSAWQVPLVCFTPKRYLRMEQSRSPIDDLTTGDFRLVLDDRARPAPATVERIALCTGKIGHELMDARDERGAPVAVVRIEQLYPWPETELLVVLDRYPNISEVCWVQEEPANMGAWNYMHGKLLRLLRGRAELRHVARKASASPASGSAKIHDREQHELVAAALDPAVRPVSS